MTNLWIRKPIDELVREADDTEKGLHRTLGPWHLVALGIGAIIGAGLFTRTATAAAYHAGPAVTLAFVVAGIGCAFAGLCYAEFASMIPIAGSAYTYSYAAMGELMAWIIGWDLVLEYAVGAATVAIAWSQYLNKLLGYFDLHIPWALCHSPFEHMTDAAGLVHHGVANVPAFFIVAALSLVLVRGTRESALLNAIIVVTKVAIVVLFIAFGWQFIRPENHTPYLPEPTTVVDSMQIAHDFGGLRGILGAAGVVFFAFIGFDAVSTTAQEAKNPKRDMPIGILGSLTVCTLLYVVFAHVLTGVASIDDFRGPGKEASVAFAISNYMHGYEWLSKLVTVAILAGFSSVILVMLLGQSRVFYSMSRDGLLPAVFSEVHPRFRTPWKSNLIFLGFCGAFATFLPEDIVGDMTSIGTLFAFILVCAGVWIVRRRHPELPRQFRTPLVPVVPILGMVVCSLMIWGLGWTNWLRLGVWMAIGFVVYFGYAVRHSHLQNGRAAS